MGMTNIPTTPETLLSPPNIPQAGPEEQFLRFKLATNTTLMLPVMQLTEVLSPTMTDVIPMPHMPAWVMGVYNWRGEILWIVDLAHLLGFTPWHQQGEISAHLRVVVTGSNLEKSATSKTLSKPLGLAVTRVEDIEWCNPDVIQSPPASAVTPEIAPFLRGYWLKPNGEMIITLDSEAIIATMPQP